MIQAIVKARLLFVISLLSFLSLSIVAKASTGFVFDIQPQATVFAQSEQSVNDYVLALDVYKKRDNRWMPEKFERRQGVLNRVTLEVPRDYSEQEVFDFYRQQLPSDAVELFSCTARSCGESNNWANDHFAIKQLYGTNTSQHYAVFRVPVSPSFDHLHYITIYTVRRGNRRLYTQLDVLSAIPPK